MFDDDFSIVFCLSAGVVVEPEYLGVGQLHQIFDLSKIHDVILAQVQFLKQVGFTWSLAHLEKSLRVLILFTLSDTTSRFGIFSINCKSSKSLPHKLRFLILCRLSDLVLVNTSSAVKGLPAFFELILIIQILWIVKLNILPIIILLLLQRQFLKIREIYHPAHLWLGGCFSLGYFYLKGLVHCNLIRKCFRLLRSFCVKEQTIFHQLGRMENPRCRLSSLVTILPPYPFP